MGVGEEQNDQPGGHCRRYIQPPAVRADAAAGAAARAPASNRLGVDRGQAGAVVPGSRAEFLQASSRTGSSSFDGWRSTMRRAGLSTLRPNGSAQSQCQVTIGGHADERGTRRPTALGDQPIRRATISVARRGGEPDAGDRLGLERWRSKARTSAWAQNRHAVTFVPAE